MMRSVGRLAQLDDHLFFLGGVIVRFLVEANPKYIREVIAVLCLEHSRPVTTPRVTRTPTTESSWRTKKRAVYRTALEKCLHMCQQRADIMYSVKETARKILFPADSDEMNMGRITRHLKSVQERKVPDRNH